MTYLLHEAVRGYSVYDECNVTSRAYDDPLESIKAYIKLDFMVGGIVRVNRWKFNHLSKGTSYLISKEILNNPNLIRTTYPEIFI